MYSLQFLFQNFKCIVKNQPTNSECIISFKNKANLSFRKILWLFIFIFSIGVQQSYAVQAYPKPIKYLQPDGTTISIILKGDERMHWAETTDGYTLLVNSKGTYEYAKNDENGNIQPSGIAVHDSMLRVIDEKNFLSTTPKNLFYSKSQISMLKSITAIKKVEAQKSFPAIGNRKLICILIGYTDLHFSKTQSEFNNLFNQINYSADGAEGSVRDYYLENSYNQLDLSVTVAGPYTASHSMAYYGANDDYGNDIRPRELITEAVKLANPDVNYANFDNDNDGSVDGVYVIYAGYGEAFGASANTIWPHAWNIPSLYLDGKTISSYSCSSEFWGNLGSPITRIGAICHEFGHVLGADDFYDVDYDNGGQFRGTGLWDLMASGCFNNDGASPAHHNPFTKINAFNWATATTITANSSITVNNAAQNKSFYRINSTTNNEYWLIENRQKVAFDSGLPGKGLLIYHVHKDINSGVINNNINATYPQKFYPVCAGSKLEPASTAMSYGEISSSSCPYPGTLGITEFSDGTVPSMQSWNGVVSNKMISNITENATNKTVSFNFKLLSTAKPANLNAVAVSTSQINVSWAKNSGNNPILVAYSKSKTFGTPVDGTTYSTGNSIPGGGTVIYYGSASNFNHTSLDPSSYYYYKAWSYGSSTYSCGITTYTSTLCSPVSNFPFNEEFSAGMMPSCWSIVDHIGNGQVWLFGNNSMTINTPTANNGFAFLDSDGYGSGGSQNCDLESPVFDFSNFSSINISFSHYFRSWDTSSATLSYSINGGSTWSVIKKWIASTVNSEAFTMNLTSQLAGKSAVKFKWNYTGSYAYHWVIDDVNVTATPLVPVNDNCSNASLLTLGTTKAGTIAGATNTISENLCGVIQTTQIKDVWYKFIATSSTHIITATPSSGLDIVMDLREGACNGSNIDCMNDGSTGYQEILNYSDFIPGNTYYIRVYQDGINSANGFSINVSVPTQPDDFYIQNFTTNLTSVIKGGTVQVSCSQCYTGSKLNAEMGSSNIGYYLSVNSTFDALVDVQLGTDVSDLGNDNPCQIEDAALIIPPGTVEGEYFILVVADYNGQFIEAYENNNVIAKPITVTTEPVTDDFYVRDASLSPATVVKGNTVNLSCGQCYSGSKLNSAISSSNLGYYLSSNTTFEPLMDIQLGTDVSDLGSDNPCLVEEAMVTVPSATQVGSYYILFVADYDGLFLESDENNNLMYRTITVTYDLSLEDFTVENVVVSNDTAIIGRTVDISCRQCYSGSNQSSVMKNVNLGYYLSPDPSFELGNDLLIGSEISDLGMDKPCEDENAVLTIPEGIVEGLYYIMVVADHDLGIPEANENNNVAKKQIWVTKGIQEEDFYIQNASVSSATVVAGMTVNASFSHCYSGSKQSTGMNDVVSGYYLSTNNSFDPIADIQLDTEISDLGINKQCESETAILTIPAGTQTGTFYILFVADLNSQFVETDENNNVLPVRIIVSPNIFTLSTNATPLTAGSTSGDGTFHAGDVCTVSATAFYGFTFVCWRENGAQVSTDPVYQFAIFSNRNLEAIFMQSTNSYVVETSSNSAVGGYVTEGGAFQNGEICTVRAFPNHCYSFVKWTEGAYTVSDEPTYQFVVMENRDLVAHFVNSATNYYISTSLEPTIGGKIIGGGVTPCGSNCVLTAEPYKEYSFLYWTENGNIVSSDASYEFEALNDRLLTANFLKDKLYFTITPNCIPNQGGVIDGGGVYQFGFTCILTASPNVGYSFKNWTENGFVISSNQSITFSVSANRTIVANFICNDLPLPGTIIGDESVCRGQKDVVYSIPEIPGATSYNWTLPAGASGFSNTNSISLDFSDDALPGILSVQGQNSCAESEKSVFEIDVVGFPAKAGIIAGKTEVCQGEVSVIYSVPDIPNAASYQWTLPDGFTGSGSNKTIIVNISSSAISGNISVKGINECGEGVESTIAVTVDGVQELGPISGDKIVCVGSSLTYSIPDNPDVLNYIWTLPGGAITSTETNSIQYYISSSFVSGSLKVKGHFNCGDGSESMITLSMGKIPVLGEIAGVSSVCQGSTEIYTVTLNPEITDYQWTLPVGASGGSTTNSISVYYSSSSNSGNISVIGKNGCGQSNASFMSVNVNPTPQTPLISVLNGILLSNTPTGNQWYLNNNPIEGAVGQAYIPSKKGDYSIRVTSNNCTSNQSNILFFEPANSIDDLSTSLFNIFPNPTTGMVNILFSDPLFFDIDFQLFNDLGLLIYSGKAIKGVNSVKLDLSPKPSGIYLIKLNMNNKHHLRKIIKY